MENRKLAEIDALKVPALINFSPFENLITDALLERLKALKGFKKKPRWPWILVVFDNKKAWGISTLGRFFFDYLKPKTMAAADLGFRKIFVARGFARVGFG